MPKESSKNDKSTIKIQLNIYGKIRVWGNSERNAIAIDKPKVYSCVKYRKYGNETNVITLQIFGIVQNETMNHFTFVISLLFSGIFQPK